MAICCACAASGHAAVAPPRRLMNSRRRISAPKLRGNIGYGSSPSRCGPSLSLDTDGQSRDIPASDAILLRVMCSWAPGGTAMPRMTALHMLRSTKHSLRSREFIISWLNHTPHATAVYASCSASPPPHATLASRRLARPCLGRQDDPELHTENSRTTMSVGDAITCDAGRRSAWSDHRCRRPKTCTQADISQHQTSSSVISISKSLAPHGY